MELPVVIEKYREKLEMEENRVSLQMGSPFMCLK